MTLFEFSAATQDPMSAILCEPYFGSGFIINDVGLRTVSVRR